MLSRGYFKIWQCLGSLVWRHTSNTEEHNGSPPARWDKETPSWTPHTSPPAVAAGVGVDEQLQANERTIAYCSYVNDSLSMRLTCIFTCSINVFPIKQQSHFNLKASVQWIRLSVSWTKLKAPQVDLQVSQTTSWLSFSKVVLPPQVYLKLYKDLPVVNL